MRLVVRFDSVLDARMAAFAFEPCRQRTADVDMAIRQALAASVAAVLDQASRFGIAVSGDFGAWRHELLAMKRAPPQLWACYHELIQAVARADQDAITVSASTLLACLPRPVPRPGHVVTIVDDQIGADNAARYRAVIDNDPERPLDLRAASESEVTRIATIAAETRPLLARAAPSLLDEIDMLGHQIVLATSRGPRGFGGAASIFLWGAVVLNPALVPDRVTLVEALAHESAHALLFGLTLGADLTTNDPAERYSSPLRPDPRPMEGIVHATFVLARMIYALDAISASEGLGGGECALVERKIEGNMKHYGIGLEAVDAHARFTQDGAAIFDACREAVRARRGRAPFPDW